MQSSDIVLLINKPLSRTHSHLHFYLRSNNNLNNLYLYWLIVMLTSIQDGSCPIHNIRFSSLEKLLFWTISYVVLWSIKPQPTLYRYYNGKIFNFQKKTKDISYYLHLDKFFWYRCEKDMPFNKWVIFSPNIIFSCFNVIKVNAYLSTCCMSVDSTVFAGNSSFNI